MQLDSRIKAIQTKVAAERAAISQLNAQNEDPSLKTILRHAANLVDDVEEFFLRHSLNEQDVPAAVSMWLGLAESAMHIAVQQRDMVQDTIAKLGHKGRKE